MVIVVVVLYLLILETPTLSFSCHGRSLLVLLIHPLHLPKTVFTACDTVKPAVVMASLSLPICVSSLRRDRDVNVGNVQPKLKEMSTEMELKTWTLVSVATGRFPPCA